MCCGRAETQALIEGSASVTTFLAPAVPELLKASKSDIARCSSTQRGSGRLQSDVVKPCVPMKSNQKSRSKPVGPTSHIHQEAINCSQYHSLRRDVSAPIPRNRIQEEERRAAPGATGSTFSSSRLLPWYAHPPIHPLISNTHSSTRRSFHTVEPNTILCPCVRRAGHGRQPGVGQVLQTQVLA